MIPIMKLKGNAGSLDQINRGLCLMQMVEWFSELKSPASASNKNYITDHPSCASEVLASYGIRLNDYAPSQEDRDSLWPLVWMLIGSRDDDFIECQRALLLKPTLRKLNVAREAFKNNRVFAFKNNGVFKNNMPLDRTCQATKAEWLEFKAKFEEAIMMGKHGEGDPVEYKDRADELKKLLETV